MNVLVVSQPQPLHSGTGVMTQSKQDDELLERQPLLAWLLVSVSSLTVFMRAWWRGGAIRAPALACLVGCVGLVSDCLYESVVERLCQHPFFDLHVSLGRSTWL